MVSSSWMSSLVVGWLSLSTLSSGFTAKPQQQQQQQPRWRLRSLASTTKEESPVTAIDDAVANKILLEMSQQCDAAKSYVVDMFDLQPHKANMAFHTLFQSIYNAVQTNNLDLGLKGTPFLLRNPDILNALRRQDDDDDDDTQSPFSEFFTLQDLAKATQNDFLDAVRGSTDNRKGWQITTVSEPRGDSFEEARMTFDDIQEALEKGTVILNAAGAHIPKLASPSLICTDATYTPNAINLYVTAAGKKTSAPPHTDKQDVIVIQTSGSKHWRVYSPPNPALAPRSDIYKRGKLEDNLSLYTLENLEGCDLLLDTILNEGDVLFVPAAFPHTTSTAKVVPGTLPKTSVHLTFNIDTHVWDLNYLSARRYALQRANVEDTALGQQEAEDYYTGAVNQLPDAIRKDLFHALPLGLLKEDEDEDSDTTPNPTVLAEQAAAELERISRAVDEETAAAVEPKIWKETIERIQQQGRELYEIHRDMYVAAIEEGRTRDAEEAMTAHLKNNPKNTNSIIMTPERIQRLSIFRVKPFYDKIAESKQALQDWALQGRKKGTTTTTVGAEKTTTEAAALPDNWEFTLPVNVGDKVEADLGGAFFEATVTRVNGALYDVQFFDGDVETGLSREMMKLVNPPKNSKGEDTDLDIDTSQMTPKQLKRWKKAQEKKKVKK